MSKGMKRAGIKGRYVSEAQRDKIMERLKILGPDDKYAPRLVRDEIDYLTGLLRGKGSAGTDRTFKKGGAVKNKRGGSKIKQRDLLPKAKPKVTKGDIAKKVLKTTFQAAVQYPYLVTKGLLTKDKDSVKKGFKVLDKLKKQKGKIKKGDVKTPKVQKALKMVKLSKGGTDYRKGGMVISTVDNRKKK